MAINHVLITSDLSERSDRALTRGLSLAAALRAKVKIVSIVDEALPKDVANTLVVKSTDHLTATAREQGVEAPVVLVEKGDPLQRLVEIVNDPDYDLVVAGIHRTRGFLERLRPSTVESLVTNSTIPVLVVVGPVHGPYRRVLAPVAFSQACRRAVEVAMELAPEAGLRLFHAWMAPFEGLTGGATSQLARAVERETRALAREWGSELPAGVPAVDLHHGSVVGSVYSEARTQNPDLVAIGANTRSLSFTGLGAFAADLIREPPADLLIARGSKAEE